MDILIDADLYRSILLEESQQNLLGLLIAQNTIIDWIITGPISSYQVRAFTYAIATSEEAGQYNLAIPGIGGNSFGWVLPFILALKHFGVPTCSIIWSPYWPSRDYRILELLYEEAKHNVISGRYIMEPIHYLMLAGIQARIELGPFNAHCHTNGFFRENQSRFLPQHIAKHSSWSWLPISRKTSAEVKLLEQFKRVPQTASTRKLVRKYLEICWALPFYGAAFFHGQLEQSINGVMSLINHKDAEVTIAVNERGIFIIDPLEYTLLLGLRHTDLSWDFGKPSSFNDPECITCIFLQFDAMENGVEISKLVQIFSRQAPMIDALIYYFTENNKKLICENKAEKHQDCTYVGK